METYASLTKTDRLILESYKSVLDGLAEYLGPGYEIVLHSLEDISHSAIKVINGHYTGRSEGAPITSLALEKLSQLKKTGDNHKNMVYFNRNKKGAPIRAATLPIVGEQEQIIGLLCINFYMDMPLHQFLGGMLKLDNANAPITETFASSSADLIVSTLEEARVQILHDPGISSANKNKEIIAILYHKDIFHFKDAVTRVADCLGISKNTVYMHIRNLNEEQQGAEG